MNEANSSSLQRAGDLAAPDRVGAVENQDVLAALLGRLQDQAERRDVGVEPSPDVLDIVDQDVDPLEVPGLGLAVPPVQADDRQAGRLIPAVGDRGVDLAANAVLGAEEFDELHARCPEEDVDRRGPAARPAGMIRDQPDFPIPQRPEALLDQDVDPASDRLDGEQRWWSGSVRDGSAGRRRSRGRAPARLQPGRDRPRGCIGDGGGGQGRNLEAERRRRSPTTVGMQPAGQDDDEGLGLGIDPETRAGEAGVPEAQWGRTGRLAGRSGSFERPSPVRDAGPAASRRRRSWPSRPAARECDGRWGRVHR